MRAREKVFNFLTMSFEGKNEQRKEKKTDSLKNFKGTPRKFSDNSTKTQGKVVVREKTLILDLKTKKQTFERSRFQNLLLQK